ncbi:cell wall-associated NlpC family hydrolase [Mucilaginibacter frigoritolerans]|uniref:Cell wall-associated NlpC family hydrolase n=1 Tax=Mucilaginibacter frigoritolerans TaxID=652788 RepID=A0A562U9F5_9SPHI|nr:DUF4157 domain-containing protein [Mucilaginibacter frigoritolerans]TWJ02462.1 cell wall-associated NlpC family hydrolase [Mucilaginibacter frigoritolerans]
METATLKHSNDNKQKSNPVNGGSFFKPVIQTKLTINEPGDHYEREADHMADKVMRMTDNSVSITTFFKPADKNLQRKCQACEEEDKHVRRKENSAGETGNSGGLDSYVSSLSSSGQQMSESSRKFFEPRFGYDFSNVKLHTDTVAAKSAQSINALAYTTGNNIVFNSGQYSPESESGKKLMAHELTHVVQQGSNIQRLIRTPYPWQGVVTPASGARIRSSTDSSNPSNILASVAKGATLKVIANSGDWLQVDTTVSGLAIKGYILNTLVDDATAANMEKTVGTTMVWDQSFPGSGTDFESWASAPKEAPFPAIWPGTVMNCWEAVLMSAFKSGSINWTWIHNLYVNIPMNQWADKMSRGAKKTYSLMGPNLPVQRGDIVFFNGTSHVALATGSGSDVYTFWPPPNTSFTANGTSDKVKVYSIEALANWMTANFHSTPVVEFSAPSW